MDKISCSSDCGFTKFFRRDKYSAYWYIGGLDDDLFLTISEFDTSDVNYCGYCPSCGRKVGFREDGSPTIGKSPSEIQAELDRLYKIAYH